MSAGKIDLYAEQGATLTKRFVKRRNGEPVDLSGYSAKMQIREDLDIAAPLVATFTSGGVGASITLGGVEGTVALRIGADVTRAWTVPPEGGRLGYYDLVLIETGDATQVVRLLRGQVFLSPGLTEVP